MGNLVSADRETDCLFPPSMQDGLQRSIWHALLSKSLISSIYRRSPGSMRGKKPRGREPKPQQAGPRNTDPVNLTDEESRIMPVSGGGFEQCYNAQADWMRCPMRWAR